MVHQNERTELFAAWRALSGNALGSDGWKTIPLSGNGSTCAGRQFPGNEEAVLIRFTAVHVPPTEHLPQSRGFRVSRVDIKEAGQERWLALARRPDGNLDMFTTMVLDIIDTLRSSGTTSEERIFHLFLTRIRAWQDFMRRGTDTTLAPQAEIGLFGELVTLHGIISAGLHPAVPVEGWLGPLHGNQDFELGTGAIEVKTTIATTGFPAVIESINQLDDATRQPLFLVAVRLRIDDTAPSLPELIEQTRTLIGDDPARNTLNTKLLHAGYIDAAADHYKRRFGVVETRIILVTDQFPRITWATIPPAITAVRYELDLDRVPIETATMRGALQRLGAM